MAKGKRRRPRSTRRFHKAARQSEPGGYQGPTAGPVKITKADGTVEWQSADVAAKRPWRR